MKIKIEMEIEHCYQCPFKIKIYEQGYSAFDCSKLGAYRTIPDKGIRNDCPFRKEKE